jgi:hypothetical protein
MIKFYLYITIYMYVCFNVLTMRYFTTTSTIRLFLFLIFQLTYTELYCILILMIKSVLK